MFLMIFKNREIKFEPSTIEPYSMKILCFGLVFICTLIGVHSSLWLLFYIGNEAIGQNAEIVSIK